MFIPPRNALSPRIAVVSWCLKRDRGATLRLCVCVCVGGGGGGGEGTVSDSILGRGHKTPFLTNSL